MRIETELQGCPRCGHDSIDSPCYSIPDEGTTLRVECLLCGLEGPEAASLTGAASLWNALARDEAAKP